MTNRFLPFRILLVTVFLGACGSRGVGVKPEDDEFNNPTRVTILGYSDHAMEPFLTRDGSVLLFNNSNEHPEKTDLHWAQRVDDLTFTYRGKLSGANSPALDAVATVDSDGNLFFVTTRSYEQTLTTIYRGRFQGGLLRDVAAVQGVSSQVRGEINFDVEVSADGSTLYLADGSFRGGPVPAAADLALAVRGVNGQFSRMRSESLAAINTSALEYAAGISEDQRELFFTRVVDGQPSIYRSTRQDDQSAWRPGRRLSAITGFAEAPTIAPGGGSLYYHARRDGRMVIERVTRRAARP